ncbi:hypothetical protein [Billgrantia desiderata]|uniref:hypothetical protein n=1 Tax=Billgrantia desiderata TaxID=52021 RepID=UPI00089E7A80|nr:hypothetical protein [Halomonas desiderata]SEG30116.1 hypothetical protein SAMN04487953_12227 [Halomonas desiderata]
MFGKYKRLLRPLLDAKPSKRELRTMERVGDHLGKLALATQVGGLIAFFNPTGDFTRLGAAALFTMGVITLMVAIMLYWVADGSLDEEA